MFSFFRLSISSLALSLLTACGGGQTAVTAPKATPALSGGSVITGLVATGAPLLGASITMIDATGKSVGFVDTAGNATTSGSTSLTDGSYRLTMGVAAATLPLVIEVSGRNIAGTPVVMHSMITSNTAPTVANVTPATEAVLALLVGANPASLFSGQTPINPGIALLSNSNAVSAASSLVKSIIAINLSDAKVDPTKLDFFRDPSFAANKVGFDAALDDLRIQVIQVGGQDLLQFSNKINDAGTVGVNLATAKTELTSGSYFADVFVDPKKINTTSSLVTLTSLSGVVATGAPLLGASIRMIDALGNTVGFLDAAGNATSGSTNLNDGSYRLTIARTTAYLPLFIEVSGRNIAGTPVVLHSMITSNTSPAVANVTPATEAVLAILAGANPATLFHGPTSSNPGIALLSNSIAVKAASDLINTVILSYSGVTGAPFDFFGDPNFAANKTKLDAALEGLRIQVGQDTHSKDQLQFSDKFNTAGTIVVGIDLALAKTNLTTGNNLAPAIVINNNFNQLVDLTTLATLDKLSSDMNKIIALNGDFGDYSTLVDTNYANNDIPDRVNFLLNLSTTFINSNYQLSKFQVTGCADVGCGRLLVSALITSNSGQVVGYLSDAVSYDTGTWLFKGDGLLSDFHLYPAAYITYERDGNPTTAAPISGVFVSILSSDTGIDRVITTPNQHVFRFTDCGRTYKCLSTGQPTIATGGVSDTLLKKDLLGSDDTASGAKYQLNLAPDYSRTDNYYLPSELPNISSTSFPKLDNISSSNPLKAIDIINGTGLRFVSWQTWAAANPNMEIILVRTVITAPAVAPAGAPIIIITDAILPFIDPGKIALPAPSTKSPSNASSFQIWLGAQDSMGRRYYSNYTNIK